VTDRMHDYRTRHPVREKDFLVTWPPGDDRAETAVFPTGQPSSDEDFHAGRLWAGGAVTALLAGGGVARLSGQVPADVLWALADGAALVPAVIRVAADLHAEQRRW
jgi:hypothetical protein